MTDTAEPAGEPAGGAREAFERACGNAPFLARLANGIDDTRRRLASGGLTVAQRLRLERRIVALDVALGDLAGSLDLAAVTTRLTAFADRALHEAIVAAIEERTPGASPQGFVAIALGKQGSGELNYSSDIDPILLYDPATLPCRPREAPEDAAVRIARRVVALLQERTAEGYVLRVDLRLRPSPEATPIAMPIGAAIAYYESQALAWERAAFIRARAAAGDIALGQRFLDAIRPFVWRRSLDYGALDEILAITDRIRAHHAQGQAFGPGYDLKRGRGGIREIEFFAQIHQLIHGGRDPALRAPATRDALAALAAAGRIDAAEAGALADAYTLLRTIEHRVQMVDDRQTHVLPEGEALDRVARLHRLADGDELLGMLHPVVDRVAALFDRLAPERTDALPSAPEPLAVALAASGFDQPEEAAARIAHWRAGRYPALRSDPARAALEAVLPSLAAALSEAPAPMLALHRLDRVLERLPTAVNLLRLIEARPGLGTTLARILSHAAPLADELARRPDLLDGLIDATALAPMSDVAALVAEMQRGEAGADYQALLEHVRRVVGEKRFALGAQIVVGAADPLDVAAGYARVAEAAVEVLAAATIADFARTHGRVPGSELVIVALGRLGGGALTHASDLDLVYLFTGDFRAESDGVKPLGATLYYNRLAQRVTAALSVATAAGPLYPVDTRLRPSGNQGPLVVSVESFARYQREEAWTWEHMALARARPIFGSPDARDAVAGTIEAVLAGARPMRDIAADARAMRAEMAAHKPAAGPLDVKLLPGGLVDLEFTVHVAQLRHRAALYPDLGHAIDALAAGGFVAPELRTAHDVLTRLLVVMRLTAPEATEPDAPATRALIAASLGEPDWAAALATLTRVRESVATAWSRAGEEPA